jgi:metallophosphoesterase superfamily enzyme
MVQRCRAMRNVSAIIFRHRAIMDHVAYEHGTSCCFVHAGDPPAAWRVGALAGHVHPAVCIAGAGLQSERLPCFVLGRRRAILPAFGSFTGSPAQTWAKDDAIVAIAGERLFLLPR